MNTKRVVRMTLQGISFCLALALCGCASEQPAAWVHPLAPGGAQGSGDIVAGDHIGMHVYTNANAAAQPAAVTAVEITADVETISR